MEEKYLESLMQQRHLLLILRDENLIESSEYNSKASKLTKEIRELKKKLNY